MDASIDASELQKKIRTTLRLFDNIETQAVAMAHYFQMVLRARTPKKTGKTSESWTVHFHSKGGGSIIWEIAPDGKEDVVTFLEFGTKPHVILPKDNEGALKFEIGNETIFAQKVYHPGTKPLGLVRLTQDDVDKGAKELSVKLLSGLRTVWG